MEKETYVVQLKIIAMLDVKVDAESFKDALTFADKLTYKDILAKDVLVSNDVLTTLTTHGVRRDEWL